MPSTKPRVTLTLEPEVGETVARLAKLQGVSRAAVLSEIVHEIHEPLRRTLLLIEAAQAAPAEVRQGLRHTVEETQNQLETQLQSAGFQLAELESAVHSGTKGARPESPEAHAAGDRAAPAKAKRRKTGSNPRPSNTGVRSTKSKESGAR